MSIGEDIDGGEVVLVVIALGIGLYYVSKALKAAGLSGGFSPTFDNTSGAQLGLSCVVPSIINSGTISPSMANAIIANQIQTFPGIDPAIVKANTQKDIDITNAQAANGPNAFQVAVNSFFGTNYGAAPPSSGTALPDPCPVTDSGGVDPSF
jgi:hypothetical protein